VADDSFVRDGYVGWQGTDNGGARRPFSNPSGILRLVRTCHVAICLTTAFKVCPETPGSHAVKEQELGDAFWAFFQLIPYLLSGSQLIADAICSSAPRWKGIDPLSTK
jgi:hypothetical protein